MWIGIVVVLWPHEWRVTGSNLDGHRVSFIFANYQCDMVTVCRRGGLAYRGLRCAWWLDACVRRTMGKELLCFLCSCRLLLGEESIVWRWSRILLSGSRWCDRWARRCIDSERGLAGDILYIHIVYVYDFILRILWKPGGSHWFCISVLWIMDSWFYGFIY